MFCKICKSESSLYLFKLVPEKPSSYVARNAENSLLLILSKTFFKKSFFLSIAIKWKKHNLLRNNFGEVKNLNKIWQDQKMYVSDFAKFLTNSANHSFMEEVLCTRGCSYPNLSVSLIFPYRISTNKRLRWLFKFWNLSVRRLLVGGANKREALISKLGKWEILNVKTLSYFLSR